MRAGWPLVLLALAALAVVIGACGDDDGEAGRPAPSAASPSATAEPPQTPDSTPAPAQTPGATASAAATATATAAPTVTASPTPTATPTASATPAPRAAAPAPVRFVEALGGRRFDRPTEALPYPGRRALIAEQSGLVLLLDAASGEGGAFLDLRPRVSRRGNEEGLLSLALDPGFAANGRLYAYYSVEGGPRRTRLSRFTIAGGVADPASELVILEVAQPFSNHNGGAVRFGPDAMLYLGLGDGGSGGDPQGNGQNAGTLLGSVLRLDVREPSEAAPYRVPADNPFVGAPGARPEIWALGLRNPWRMAFDPASGELWLGDVGQSSVEEVDVVVRGGNYGWNRLEGDDCFRPRSGCDRAGTVAPVASYDHGKGCSVSGGVVYRGAAVPELAGAYVYGDFCSGRVWALDAASRGAAVRVADTGASIASFAQVGEELWLLRFGGSVLRAASP